MDTDRIGNAASRAYDDAKRLEEQGDFAGALAKHVWFHEHALDVDPACSGVRLSFALGSWLQLGRKYPLALETLNLVQSSAGSTTPR